MSRDYTGAARSKGIWLPRWVPVLLGLLALVWICLRILIPPSVVLQRLDSPDGTCRAVLERTHYIDDHYRVKIRSGHFWKTVFYSGAFTNDFRVDRRERLRWSEDSRRLHLLIEEQEVWGYDVTSGEPLSIPQKAAADPVEDGQ